MLSNLLQDMRFGLRLLAKSPAITINAVATLALAIGANTAVFSVVNSVLLRPLPFFQPDRLVMIWETNPANSQRPDRVSWRDFLFWREHSSVFENIGTFTMFNETLLGEAEAERILACRVTSNLFALLGIKPRLGRWFLPEEDALPNGRPVAILSDGFWRRAFGADPTVIGKPVRFSARSLIVVGVMPPEFHFPSKPISPGWGALSAEADVFEPLILSPYGALAGMHTNLVIGRLKPQTQLAQADTEMKLIARRLERQYPESNTGWSASVSTLSEQVVREIRFALEVFTAAVIFVLLIACANVASLLLVRNSARQKELAIRRTMGAAEGRLLRQLLTETMLLALVGGLAGLTLAYGAVRALVVIGPEALPRLEEIHVDGRALAFTLLVSLLTGLICGLIPAVQTRKSAPFDVLKAEGRGAAGSRGRIRAQQVLVAGEVALSMLLLAGAGLLLRSYLRLQSVNPGFRAERVLNLQLIAGARYPQPDQIAELFRLVTDRIAALPGVKGVGGISAPPLTAQSSAFPLVIEERPDTLTKPQTVVGLYGVTPGYFAAMGIPLERGRYISDSDKRGASIVTVIGHSLAERFWPNQDPIGKRLKVEIGIDNPWMTVVGVVGDVRFKSLDSAPTLAVYHPHAQMTWRPMAFAVRTEGPPTSLIAAIRREIAAIDRELPIYNMTPLETMLAGSIATPRFHALLILCFAGLALALAVVGAYGVMSNSVGQRTQEIGIRMALGADRGDVLGMILTQGLLIILAGCAVGLAGAIACGRVISGFLFQTAPTDPLTLAGITILLIISALLACYVPARRATRIDPMVALREN